MSFSEKINELGCINKIESENDDFSEYKKNFDYLRRSIVCPQCLCNEWILVYTEKNSETYRCCKCNFHKVLKGYEFKNRKIEKIK